MRDAFERKVRYELEQIDQLLASFGPLLNVVSAREPDLVELSALATVLHSFYGGVENVLKTIAKHIDGALPSGTGWHKDLLRRMIEPTPERSHVLSPDMYHVLTGYLSFRHFFRNSYAYNLSWEQLRHLVHSLPQTWNDLRPMLAKVLEQRKDPSENVGRESVEESR